MKKTISAILLLTLCLSLCACSFVVIPNRQNEQNTEPEVTIDPNAEPEIVLDAASTYQEPLSDIFGQVIGSLRYTEGTNCGVKGTVQIEYLDTNGNVVQTFSPQLPGGTLTWWGASWSGTMNRETEQVYEKNGHARVSWHIAPYTNGRILLYEYIEGTGGDSRCTRIDLYKHDGQLASSLEVSKESNYLHIDFPIPDWTQITEKSIIPETGSGDPRIYTVRQWIFDYNYNLAVEIIGDPAILQYDPRRMTHDRKTEIRNYAGNTQMVYEASGENTLVGASFDWGEGYLYIYEETLNHDLLLMEKRIPRSNAVAYREAHTYDESGNRLSTEYVFWNGKVLTTPSDKEDLFTKVEFYSAFGDLKKTVELIENSAYIHLNFNYGSVDGNRICEITFLSKTGEELGRDRYVSESSQYTN